MFMVFLRFRSFFNILQNIVYTSFPVFDFLYVLNHSIEILNKSLTFDGT